MSHPTDHRTTGSEHRFDDAFRAWAGRPPATPARQAGRRVADRLPAQSHFQGARRLAVAAALVAAVGAALLLRWTGAPGHDTARSLADVSRATPALGAAAPSGGDVLVIDLDSATTLYLNLDGPHRPAPN